MFVNFIASDNTLLSTSYGEYEVEQPLANITILGVENKPKEVKFDDSKVDFTFENNTIFVTGLDDQTEDGAFAKHFKLSW